MEKRNMVTPPAVNDLTPEAQKTLEEYLNDLRQELHAMPPDDREHMVDDIRAQVLVSLTQQPVPVGNDELSRVLHEVGQPEIAAEAILAEHRCSWCNEIRATVEPFDVTLKGEPLSLRAESTAHREKLLRYVAYAEKTLKLWFRLFLVEMSLGFLLGIFSLQYQLKEMLMTAVALMTIAPGLTFIIFPFLTVRGLGTAPHRFNESIATLGASRAILLARLLGVLLCFLGIYTIREFSHHPLW